MILLLLISLLDPRYVANHRDFILEKDFSTPKQREIVYLAAQDINKAVGCQVITVKMVDFVDFDHNIITFNPEALAKEGKNDIAMTFKRGPLVKVGVRSYLRNEKLFYVLVHELGHSLGVSHIMNRASIMYPFVRGSTPEVSNCRRISRKWRILWSKQIANILKKKNAALCE